MDFDPAKVTALSDVEKVRLAIALLCHRDGLTNIDHGKAAEAAGNKSKESFQKMLKNTLNKLANGGSAPATPKKPATPAKAGASGGKGRGKKRAAPDDGEDESAGEQQRKTPKKPRTKKAQTIVKREPDTEDEDQDLNNGHVSAEEVDFLEGAEEGAKNHPEDDEKDEYWPSLH